MSAGVRRTALPWLAAALAGCGTVPVTSSEQPEAELREALAGRVAGPAVECLPSRSASGPESFGGDALLFRDGGRIWLSRSEGGGCGALEGGSYTLVTRTFGSRGLCSGDLGRVVDLTTGVTAGCCVLGEFVPYTRP